VGAFRLCGWPAGSVRTFEPSTYFLKRLPDGGIKGVFTCVMEMGLVDLSDYTVDGTTLQANVRRHSAVWKSNSERYKQSAIERIEDYFDQIQQLADLEEADWQDRQAPEKADEPAWTAEQVRQTADRFDQALTALEQQADKDGGEASGEDDRKRDWKAIEI